MRQVDLWYSILLDFVKLIKESCVHLSWTWKIIKEDRSYSSSELCTINQSWAEFPFSVLGNLHKEVFYSFLLNLVGLTNVTCSRIFCTLEIAQGDLRYSDILNFVKLTKVRNVSPFCTLENTTRRIRLFCSLLCKINLEDYVILFFKKSDSVLTSRSIKFYFVLRHAIAK
jgi:hypothetical protein